METTVTTKQPRGLHVMLWIAQIVLGAMFLMAGYMKSFQPIEQLATTISWASDVPLFIRFIGVSELLGGIGLILPAALRIKTYLTWWAALALAFVMVLAVFYHLFRSEFAAIGTNLILLLLALFIVWGRTKGAPIESRI